MRTFFLSVAAFLLVFTTKAQDFSIRQDLDNVLFFNETNQTVEVWLRMHQVAVNEIIAPKEMKKYESKNYITPEDLNESEIFYGYTFRALTHDIQKSLSAFEKELELKRKVLNRGYKKLNQPFYQLEAFAEFLETDTQDAYASLKNNNLSNFVKDFVLPKSKNILANVQKDNAQYPAEAAKLITSFLKMNVQNDGELSLFIEEMNRLDALFKAYENVGNERKDLGSLAQNGFKIADKQPGTDIGMYMTTNNLKLVKNYNYREMDTRGFNFEIAFNQRFAQSRISKKKMLTYHGALSYLSLKDDEFDLKKSFINVGPQIRLTGYESTRIQLIGEAGASIDITTKENMSPEDNRKIGMYAGTELSLLFFRVGMRYYSGLAESDLMPEGNLFYRLGIMARF